MADSNFNSTPVAFPFGLKAIGQNVDPTLVDIDHDGDLDVFATDLYGTIQFFRNTGTVTAPNFISETNIFGLKFVKGLSERLTFADIDADGDLDAFVTNNTINNKIIHFYRNMGTSNAPKFITENNNFGLISSEGQLTPTFVDIDGDGDLDAFIGGFQGDIQFFRNTGTVSTPNFVSESGNFGLTKIQFDLSSVPSFVDIDHDGDLDAFISYNSQDTRFFRNIGTTTAPHFIKGTFSWLNNAGGYKIEFADIDKDGDLDAFVGNQGIVLYLGNDQPTLTAFASPIANGDEETQIAITLTQLKTQGNEADKDGVVTAFVVSAVTSGTLKIGTSAETATIWYPCSNDIIDSNHHAFWTP
jgi:FG-GAP-like repeat